MKTVQEEKVSGYKAVLVGLCMGIADAIPGISGGTIAFLAGIYDNIIDSISYCTRLPLRFASGDFRIDMRKMSLLAIVFLGVIAGLFLAARPLHFVLTTYPYHAATFMFGLISAALLHMFSKHVGYRSPIPLVWLVIGGVLGTLFFTTQFVSVSSVIWLVVMLAGAVMIIPGVSGSYVLYALGAYTTVLSYVKDPLNHISELLTIAIAAATGILLSVFFIQKALRKYHANSYGFFCGLLFASLLPLISQVEQLPIVLGITLFSIVFAVTAVLLHYYD